METPGLGDEGRKLLREGFGMLPRHSFLEIYEEGDEGERGGERKVG